MLSRDIQASTQQFAVNMANAELPEGISAITLYDEQGKPNCERLIYIHHPATGDMDLSTEKRLISRLKKPPYR